MKRYIAGLLTGIVISATLGIALAGTVRENLYQQWGPRILEAVVRVCQDEFNRNRTWHSQPQITDAAMVTAMTNKLSSIAPYPWQTNDIPR